MKRIATVCTLVLFMIIFLSGCSKTSYEEERNNQREAEKIVRENMMQNIPKVDVNLTDPFEGL